MDAKDQALLELGRELQARDYRFITVTPASHHRVYRRPNCAASLLERVFGWSRPFQRADLPSNIVALLEQAEELESDGDLLRAKVRFSSLGRQLFVHSSFPTESADAVFFGPDTYRFARALRHSIAGMQASASFTVIDIGCGSGAGGLHAASLLQRGVPPDVILSDINPRALRYSRINAWLNGISNVRTVLSDVFERINEGGDLIVSNPPYLIDQSARLLSPRRRRSRIRFISSDRRRQHRPPVSGRPSLSLHRQPDHQWRRYIFREGAPSIGSSGLPIHIRRSRPGCVRRGTRQRAIRPCRPNSRGRADGRCLKGVADEIAGF